MDELSLYILDITMNSVRAGATEILIELVENQEDFIFSVTDNGCGMSDEQVKRLSDPFFTTRKTRKVGLGVPFLTMLANMTGGEVKIISTPEAKSDNHGTKITARFVKSHIDFIPLGDIISTVKTLIQGSPEINFTFSHTSPDGKVYLNCKELRKILGDVPLSEPEVLLWIDGYLKEQYEEIKNV